jgi:hypothetical protein
MQTIFFNIFAKELPTISIEKHIIFCQKDISESTKVVSDLLKSKLSVNNNKERTKIINVYTEGLLKKYTNAILQKNKNKTNEKKSKKTKKYNKPTKKHFFYVIVETEEVKEADKKDIYPIIKISTKEYKNLKQTIINKLKNEGYTIANNKNNARYILSVKIEDILRTNAP